ncbi:MAG: hypothetical protein WC767_01910 [Candidatus Paceibacterota bacterium]|jgi:hypothetical protein
MKLLEEFGWFIFGLIGLALMWFVMGGPERDIAREGLYLKPPAPLDSGKAYGGAYISNKTREPEVITATFEVPATKIIKTASEEIGNFFLAPDEAAKIHGVSLLSRRFILDGKAGAESSDPAKEYVRVILHAEADKPEVFSGLTLQGSALNVSATVPKGTILPLVGVKYKEEPIVLSPGDRAIVISGRSPIGTSFAVNMCTGYLGQFQEFTPELRRDCPEPLTELKSSGPYGDATCRGFVGSISRCSTSEVLPPSYLSDACKTFVIEKLNYNSCVLRHQNDEGFRKSEWRVFLGKTGELWKSGREVIRLLDAKGVTLDAITY